MTQEFAAVGTFVENADGSIVPALTETSKEEDPKRVS